MSEINTGASGSADSGAAAGGGAASGGANGGAASGSGAASGTQQGGTGAAQGGGTGTGGNAGGGGASWLDGLSPEHKADAGLTGFKTVDDLAKSYLHASKMVGADKIVIPTKHATDQDWEQVYTKLGRPESADKYEFKLADGHKPEDIKGFREAAFKAGMLPKQVEAMYAFDQERIKQMTEANKTHRDGIIKGGLDTLKKEWAGKDGAEYKENLAKSAMALNTIGKEYLDWADKCGVGDDPMFIKLMHKVSGMMAEDTLRGAGGAASFGESRASIQGKIDTVMANSKHPYWVSDHPGHKAAVQEVAGLQEMVLRAK